MDSFWNVLVISVKHLSGTEPSVTHGLKWLLPLSSWPLDGASVGQKSRAQLRLRGVCVLSTQKSCEQGRGREAWASPSIPLHHTWPFPLGRAIDSIFQMRTVLLPMVTITNSHQLGGLKQHTLRRF